METQKGDKNISARDSSSNLVNRQTKTDDTIINVNGIIIGGGEIVIIAGPCAVENREQLLETAKKVHSGGANLLRGGAFKPRTSPYSFQGLGEEGLQYLNEAREITGLPVVTEVMDTRDMEMVCNYTDIIQIGSRNMHNFPLLKEAGKCRKPVLFKRGLMATVDEYLLAAEYILKEGNDQVILCERGIRTFETSTRNTLDLSAVPVLKQKTHLPVIVDPSHGTGQRWLVPIMAKAAIVVGADGVMVEVHHKPEEALSDGQQSLYPEDFVQMVREIEEIARAVGKELYHYKPLPA
ncbi:MAG: 3-deoxy-7-phosphoheptulonate synthase [Chlorobi bacterium]|nr:3-deoxy-7-phosphoheptulonate synthase [Chlorobiota bacterium]